MLFLKETNRKEVYIITITCSACGCKDFYRDAEMAKHCTTYLEGHFNCSNCHTEYYYHSEELVKKEVTTQLELF